MTTLKARARSSGTVPSAVAIALDDRLRHAWRQPALLVPAREPHFAYRASRRAIDVSVSLLLLALLLPVIIVACALIALETHQKPILRQVRVGYLGREFGMLKLRTMHTDERETTGRELPGGVFVYKAANDARVFPIGRLLRRTSIDELPQLVNVLAGQMSLVGPRPGLPIEVGRYPTSWRRRLTVKPGLTGLWQVSGRSKVEPRRRTAMDRYYTRRRSLLFDCRILVRTIAAVVSMRGAW